MREQCEVQRRAELREMLLGLNAAKFSLSLHVEYASFGGFA